VSPTFTITEGPAGTVSLTLPVAVVRVTTLAPFSPGSIEATVPAAGAVKALLLVFSPVGFTWPRPRLPPTCSWYLPKWMALSVAGVGERIGKTIFWC